MKLARIPVTTLLLLIIAIVFVLQLRIDGAREMSVLMLGGIRPETLGGGQLWHLFAAMFLHFGWLHVATNLYALYQLVGVFELLFGSGRMLLVYFVTGLLASLTSALTIDPNTLAAGASGAVFGVMGALLVTIKRSPRWRNQSWTRGLTQQLMFWAAINVMIGFTVPGIDNAAHLGGFAAGLVLGLLPHGVPPPPAREQIIDTSAEPPASSSS